MPVPIRALPCVLAALLLVSACGGGRGLGEQPPEYEEEIYLGLDGSATVNVNASVASLVALRGADLPIDPRARLDRGEVRDFFSAEGVEPTVSLSRRDGRRFVHVRLEVDDLRQLARIAPLSWSSYRFDRRDDVFEYRQVVGPPADASEVDAGWTGAETVAFKMHLPSEIFFHNSPDDIQRGNILEWEQPLRARLAGEPLELQAQIATESILQTTLLLFGGTIAAVAATFGVVLWWVVRRARGADLAESRP